MNDLYYIAYNKAIEDALREYKNGIGAIASLRIPFDVTVEHIGTTTKQEVNYGKRDV